MSIASKIVKNTVINGVDLLVTLLFGFLTVPILLGRVGEEVFGIYSLILVFSVSGFMSFFDFGFEGALIKYLAKFDSLKDYKRFSQYFWNGILLYSLIGLCLFLIFFVALNLTGFFPFKVSPELLETGKKVIGLYILQFPFQFLSLGFRALLSSVHKFGVLKAINIVHIVVNFGLIYFYFKVESDFIGYIILFNVLFIIKCLFEFLAAVAVIDRVHRFNFLLDIKVIKELFDFAKYLFVSKVVGFVYNFTDKLLISFLLPISNLSRFNILIKVPNLITSISSVLNSTVIPITSNLVASQDDRALSNLLIKGTKFKLLLTVPLSIACISVVREFIGLWVGNEYIDLAPLSIILLMQFMFSQFTSFGSTMVVGSGYVKQVLPFSVLGSILNLGISLTLLPRYGLLGLVIGTTISHAVIFIPYIKKILGLYGVTGGIFWAEIRGVLLSFLLFLLISFVIGDLVVTSTWLLLSSKLLLMLLIYYLGAYLFILGKEEKAKLKNLLARRQQ